MLRLESDKRLALAGQVPDVVHLADFNASSWSSELDHVSSVQIAWYVRPVRSLSRHVERVVKLPAYVINYV